MNRWFRYGFAAAAALIALVLALPFLLPASIYKAQVEQAVTRATGRSFTISGPLRFALFPELAIQANQVALANTPGGHAPALATADDVKLGLRLWPLLHGRVEITRIVLDRPAINLEVDTERRANWTLAQSQRSDSHNSSPRMSMSTRFSGVEIVHGRLSYANRHSGTTYALNDINAEIGFTTLDQPADVTGSFTTNGQRVAIKAKVATPQRLLRNQTAQIDVSLVSDFLSGHFTGTVAPNGQVEGHIALDTPSTRRAATWLGARLPEIDGLGALSLQSRIVGDNRSAALTDLTFRMNGMSAQGEIEVDAHSAVPFVKGTLSIDRLDLNPYIQRPRKPGAVHQHRDSESWSDTPFTLDILKKADADLTLNVGGLAVRKLRLGKTKIAVVLNGARLKARLDPVALYGGNGRAMLDVDARGTPVFHNKLEFDNIALQSFLPDTLGVKQIEGTGTIKLDLTSRGDSADTIMRNIGGVGSIAFHDGKLRGVDLGKVAHEIQSLLGSAIHPEAFTTYKTMVGSFVAAKGVLTSNNFQIAGPVLSMTGTGAVDIGNRSIDFMATPQATAVIGEQKYSLGVPFHIKGPWKHVHYTADFSGVVSSVLDNLNAGRAPFKGLLGSKPKDPNAPKKKHKNIDDALKNMLGIH